MMLKTVLMATLVSAATPALADNVTMKVVDCFVSAYQNNHKVGYRDDIQLFINDADKALVVMMDGAKFYPFAWIEHNIMLWHGDDGIRWELDRDSGVVVAHPKGTTSSLLGSCRITDTISE